MTTLKRRGAAVIVTLVSSAFAMLTTGSVSGQTQTRPESGDFVIDGTDGHSCGGYRATIVCAGGLCSGTSGDDVIIGTNGIDEIHGLTGDDKICAGAGDDTVYGDDGDDYLIGQDGRDRIYGGSGQDHIHGTQDPTRCCLGEPTRIRCLAETATMRSTAIPSSTVV